MSAAPQPPPEPLKQRIDALCAYAAKNGEFAAAIEPSHDEAKIGSAWSSSLSGLVASLASMLYYIARSLQARPSCSPSWRNRAKLRNIASYTAAQAQTTISTNCRPQQQQRQVPSPPRAQHRLPPLLPPLPLPLPQLPLQRPLLRLRRLPSKLHRTLRWPPCRWRSAAAGSRCWGCSAGLATASATASNGSWRVRPMQPAWRR